MLGLGQFLNNRVVEGTTNLMGTQRKNIRRESLTLDDIFGGIQLAGTTNKQLINAKSVNHVPCLLYETNSFSLSQNLPPFFNSFIY